MPVAALKVIIDREEYSRFEPSRSVVRARVLPSPATGLADAVTVDLCRKDGIVLATQTVLFAGDQLKGAVVMFQLADIKSSDGYPTVVRGDYTIKATCGDVSGSAPFIVSIITVEELKAGYCRGMSLYSREIMAPRKQPSLVTGVTIKTVSSGSSPGLYILKFTAPATLQWNDGPAVSIEDGLTSEILPDASGAYIEVRVDSFDLPAGNATEGILIDQETLTDAALRSEIQRAVSELENRIIDSPVEPLRMATEPYFSNPAEGEYYDKLAQPAAFYRKDVFNMQSKAWHVSMPYQQLNKVYRMEGYVGDEKSLDVSEGVFKCNVRQGIVEVLPASSTYTYFMTFFSQLDYWGIREYIADFWRYTALIGLRDLDPDLIKAIGYSAAIPVLTSAGMAARGGYQSVSISKDGVSQSSSTSKGLYSAAVDEYKEWLNDNRQRLATRYKGLTMVTL